MMERGSVQPQRTMGKELAFTVAFFMNAQCSCLLQANPQRKRECAHAPTRSCAARTKRELELFGTYEVVDMSTMRQLRYGSASAVAN